jgi:hypothetical protein
MEPRLILVVTLLCVICGMVGALFGAFSDDALERWGVVIGRQERERRRYLNLEWLAAEVERLHDGPPGYGLSRKEIARLMGYVQAWRQSK